MSYLSPILFWIKSLWSSPVVTAVESVVEEALDTVTTPVAVNTTQIPEEPQMSDDTLVTQVAPVEAPVAAPVSVNTDTLKAVLAALGHDLEAVWEDAIALAKKAV
jgi:hypothetical protein